MALTIKKSDNGWYIREDGCAAIQCPACGEDIPLSDHEVEGDYVRPSVECPNDDCDFNQFVRLEDWHGDEES